MQHAPEDLRVVPRSVLLDQQAAHCFGLLHGTDHAGARRFLRLLAIDLIIEADKQRRSLKVREAVPAISE